MARESRHVVLHRRVQVIRPAYSPRDVFVDGLRSLAPSAGLLRAMAARVGLGFVAALIADGCLWSYIFASRK